MKLRPLFAADQFTQVEWAVRRMLDGKPLAQWLHGYYASHAKPYPIKMETLLTLSGSETVDPRSSRQTLRKALDALTEASASSERPFIHSISGDLVTVKTTPSESQQRHLSKRVSPAKKRRV